jgi:hypothetical protein
MSTLVSLSFDEPVDTLYALRKGARVHRSNPSEHDGGFIVSVDSSGNVVGLILLDATEVGKEWMTHSDRITLPDDLRIAVDEWFLTKSSGATKILPGE